MSKEKFETYEHEEHIVDKVVAADKEVVKRSFRVCKNFEYNGVRYADGTFISDELVIQHALQYNYGYLA